MKIKILQLYPRDMNLYGDLGNRSVICQRLIAYGYDPIVINYNPGDAFPNDTDIVLGGGGQDSGQYKIQNDLLKIGPKLAKLANNDVPMLLICGLYQLFGHFFKTSSSEIINGIGLLDIETYGKSERLIGNIITSNDEFGDIIGYENHSGQTFLGKKAKPLGIVRIGAGNNLIDSQEGARYKNVIGTYLHGALLPKNPKIADFIIEKAAINRYGEFHQEQQFNDSIAKKARFYAAKRPR